MDGGESYLTKLCEPVVADITSRMELLKRIGAEIPNLKSRKEGKSGVPKTDAPTSSAAQMAVAAQMAARDQQMAAMAAQAAAAVFGPSTLKRQGSRPVWSTALVAATMAASTTVVGTAVPISKAVAHRRPLSVDTISMRRSSAASETSRYQS